MKNTIPGSTADTFIPRISGKKREWLQKKYTDGAAFFTGIPKEKRKCSFFLHIKQEQNHAYKNKLKQLC